MKAAHLRNVYQKVGRFDQPGPQVSGFGLGHDGSMDTIIRFLKVDVFEFPGETEAEKDVVRGQLNAFIMAFHTGMAPAVGLQLTAMGALDATQQDLLGLMIERADAGDCDLIARSWGESGERGWLWRDGEFVGDRVSDARQDVRALLERQRPATVNFLCVPPGDGIRSALDRDLDGVFDGDERRLGSDEANAAVIPSVGTN
jgi:hypothetical protein